ncbi:hypothetical protein FB451DRAFT_1377709 [Mycena latifolia]|nr:hypothetical protein FB451DRAFT_1377709 [Mycena latifolia]
MASPGDDSMSRMRAHMMIDMKVAPLWTPVTGRIWPGGRLNRVDKRYWRIISTPSLIPTLAFQISGFLRAKLQVLLCLPKELSTGVRIDTDPLVVTAVSALKALNRGTAEIPVNSISTAPHIVQDRRLQPPPVPTVKPTLESLNAWEPSTTPVVVAPTTLSSWWTCKPCSLKLLRLSPSGEHWVTGKWQASNRYLSSIHSTLPTHYGGHNELGLLLFLELGQRRNFGLLVHFKLPESMPFELKVELRKKYLLAGIRDGGRWMDAFDEFTYIDPLFRRAILWSIIAQAILNRLP